MAKLAGPDGVRTPPSSAQGNPLQGKPIDGNLSKFLALGERFDNLDFHTESAEAHSIAQQLLELAPKSGELWGSANLCMGKALCFANDPKAAIPYLEIAVKENPKGSLNRGLSFYEYGRCLTRLGEGDPIGMFLRAAGAFTSAKDKALAMEDKKEAGEWLAWSLSTLADLYAARGEIKDAEIYSGKAETAMAEATGEDSSEYVRVLLSSGELAFSMERYEEARCKYERALKIVEGEDDINRNMQCDVLSNLCEVSLALGDPEAALQQCNKVISIVEADVDEDIWDLADHKPLMLAAKGRILLAMNKPSDSLEFLGEALGMLDELEDDEDFSPGLRANILVHQAECYVALKQHADVIKCYTDAMNVVEGNFGPVSREGLAQRKLLLEYMSDSGEHESAISVADQYLGHVKQCVPEWPESREYGEALLISAEVIRQAGGDERLEESRDLAQQALDIAETRGDTNLQLDALMSLYIVCERRQEFEDALGFAESMVSLADQFDAEEKKRLKAEALIKVARMQSALDKDEEAVQSAINAYELHRQLAGDKPSGDVAESLHHIGSMYSGMAQTEEGDCESEAGDEPSSGTDTQEEGEGGAAVLDGPEGRVPEAPDEEEDEEAGGRQYPQGTGWTDSSDVEGQEDRAEQYFREAIDMFQRAEETNSHRYAVCIEETGFFLQEKNPQEALYLLDEATALFERLEDEDPNQTLHRYERMAELAETLGLAEKKAQYQAFLAQFRPTFFADED